VLSEDYQRRCEGARALRYFHSDENIARAKALLEDVGYSVLRQAEHNDGVEVRVFGVRGAAYETLKYWGIDVEKPVMKQAVRETDRIFRGAQRHDDRPRGNIRPGAFDHPL
jgi:hypothetical protein